MIPWIHRQGHDFTSRCLGWQFQFCKLQVDPKQNPGGLVGGESIYNDSFWGVRDIRLLPSGIRIPAWHQYCHWKFKTKERMVKHLGFPTKQFEVWSTSYLG